VFSNEPIENGASFGQALERADLVSAHEAAVAVHPLRRLRREIPSRTVQQAHNQQSPNSLVHLSSLQFVQKWYPRDESKKFTTSFR
jgi:hypothetical protein